MNKANQIRQLLEDLGVDVASREIIERLKDDGVRVTPQQVANEKAKLRKLGVIVLNPKADLGLIRKVKRLVDEVGSLELVRKALDELEQLQVKRSDDA